MHWLVSGTLLSEIYRGLLYKYDTEEPRYNEPLYTLHTVTAAAVRAAVKTVVSYRCSAKCTGCYDSATTENRGNSSIFRFVSKSKSL